MQVMPGWTIDQYDLGAGVVAMCGLVVIAMCVRVLKQLYDFDVAAEECRDECQCPGSGHEPREEPDTCRRCGRYVEIGGE